MLCATYTPCYFYTKLLTISKTRMSKRTFQFLDTKTGKPRYVHPDLANNRAWLAKNHLTTIPQPKAPPVTGTPAATQTQTPQTPKAPAGDGN